MPLHIDHRPTKFKQFAGNKVTVSKLQSMLKGSFPHTILFKGRPGCGKTTLAGILAPELGCPFHSNAFKELNVGKDRGIAYGRQIAEEIKYKTIGGHNRVYVLDECQKATSDFWGSMLIPLEKTPKHVYFILCTTDPQKLPKAVLSRCSQFDVLPLKKKTMTKLLKAVLKKHLPPERIEKMEKVLSEICKLSEGIPRDALVILNQVYKMDSLKEMINATKNYIPVEVKEMENLARALLKKESWQNVAGILRNLEKEKVAPETVRMKVLAYMKAVLLNSKGTNMKTTSQVSLVFEYFDETFQFNDGGAKLVFACHEITTTTK